MLADEEDFPDFSLARLKSKNWKCRRNQVKNTTGSSENTDLIQVDQGEDFEILRFITLLQVTITCIFREKREKKSMKTQILFTLSWEACFFACKIWLCSCVKLPLSLSLLLSFSLLYLTILFYRHILLDWFDHLTVIFARRLFSQPLYYYSEVEIYTASNISHQVASACTSRRFSLSLSLSLFLHLFQYSHSPHYFAFYFYTLVHTFTLTLVSLFLSLSLSFMRFNYLAPSGSMKSEQTNNSDVIDSAQGLLYSSSQFNCSTAKTDSPFNSNASPFYANKGKANNLTIRGSSRTLPRFFAHHESSLHDPSKSSKFREKARKLMKEAVYRSSGTSDDRFNSPSYSTASTFARISPTSTTYPYDKPCDDALKSNTRQTQGKAFVLCPLIVCLSFFHRTIAPHPHLSWLFSVSLSFHACSPLITRSVFIFFSCFSLAPATVKLSKDGPGFPSFTSLVLVSICLCILLFVSSGRK